jgi:pseudouridine synthase
MQRLQNILAQRGIASRRGAADLIREGAVSVDGQIITEPGFRIDPMATITCHGRPVPKMAETHRTFLYHKPVGEVCSTDGQGAKSVLDAFNAFKLRLVPVGRLDKESEGLLLISNDGDLIQKLTHPRFAHQKVYEVEVNRDPDEDQLTKLRSPLVIEGYRIRPVPVKRLAPRLLQFKLSEGRHRQIRQMCEQAGLRVTRLRRIALSNLSLGSLPPGHYRELSVEEIKHLLSYPPETITPRGAQPPTSARQMPKPSRAPSATKKFSLPNVTPNGKPHRSQGPKRTNFRKSGKGFA